MTPFTCLHARKCPIAKKKKARKQKYKITAYFTQEIDRKWKRFKKWQKKLVKLKKNQIRKLFKSGHFVRVLKVQRWDETGVLAGHCKLCKTRQMQRFLNLNIKVFQFRRSFFILHVCVLSPYIVMSLGKELLIKTMELRLSFLTP